jgi:hypothetical protein
VRRFNPEFISPAEGSDLKIILLFKKVLANPNMMRNIPIEVDEIEELMNAYVFTYP